LSGRRSSNDGNIEYLEKGFLWSKSFNFSLSGSKMINYSTNSTGYSVSGEAVGAPIRCIKNF
jgi:hypothetical protein